MNSKQEKHLIQYYENLAEELSYKVNLLEKIIAKKKAAKKKAKKDYDKDGKLESPEEEWKGSRDAAIKMNMAKKSKKKFASKKKQKLQEGTVITDGELCYGGFPRILRENEEEGNWQEFIGLVNQAQRGYFDSLPGIKGKKTMPSHIDRMVTAFINDPSEAGDNVTDDLIQAGFPAETIGRAARIRRASIKQQKASQGRSDPSLRGTYRPGFDRSASPFD